MAPQFVESCGTESACSALDLAQRANETCNLKDHCPSQEDLTMATEIAQKSRQQDQRAPRRETLVPYLEFPFSLARMRDEFDRLWDQLARWPSLWQGDGLRRCLRVEDKENAIIVRAEAPGFEADDFDIRVSDHLVLSASRKVESKDKEGKTREYHEQECYESVMLPPGIDKDKVEALYRNGILTITLPKTTEGKAKRITVKT